MKDPIKDLQTFREFLGSIPLSKYREELKDVKWVEQDLPKEILPLGSIFKYYWENRQFLNFEAWFEDFWSEINTEPQSKRALEEFKRYYFNRTLKEDGWFKKGFKARMYRTWISVLTQLDFCYLFEYICVLENRKLTLECNAELDVKGITIPYAVFNVEEFERLINSPRVKDKSGYQKSLQSFNKYFIRLKNGFVVFHENYVKPIIENIDDSEKVRKAVEQISSELSGEYNL